MGRMRPTVSPDPRIILAGLLALALALRLFTVWTQVHGFHADETFQYLEQGHRLAFGSGLIPWEFFDGIRSWLLPGLIAVVMRAVSLLTSEPLAAVRVVRSLCAVLSLGVVYGAFRVARTRDGLVGAALAGFVAAVWFESIFFSSAVMTEMIAAHVGLLAICLGDGRPASSSPGRLMAIGALFGLAVYLRFHYAPGLAVAALWQYRRAWRQWGWLLAGATAVFLPLGGVLDLLTWGRPFQTIWLNLQRNVMEGVAAEFSEEPVTYYVRWIWWMWQPAIVLVPLIVMGAIRMPALGLAAATVLLTHSLIAHKEYRLIYFVLASAPVLIGLGGAWLVRQRWALAAGLAALIGGLSLAAGNTGLMATRWQQNGPNLMTFVAAHEQPDLCGISVEWVVRYNSGGYTYLHRDVPIFYSEAASRSKAPVNPLLTRSAVILNGVPVRQLPGMSFAQDSRYFNYLVAPPWFNAPGFAMVACFGDDATPATPRVCLWRRPGGCEAPPRE